MRVMAVVTALRAAAIVVVIGVMVRRIRGLRRQIEPAHDVGGARRRIEQPGIENLCRVDDPVPHMRARRDRIDGRELGIKPRQRISGG